MITDRRRPYIIAILLSIVVVMAFSSFANTIDNIKLTYQTIEDGKKAAGMLQEAHKEGDKLIEYGNWYGPGWWGGSHDPKSPGAKPPVDELDALAMRHDFAYELADKWEKIYGEREAQRIRSIADAIAVRDASRLDKDPSKWNPPASNPEQADRYRRRIIFGFGYLSSGREKGSKALNAIDWASSPIENAYSNYDENRLTPDMLQKHVKILVKNWYNKHPPLPTFHLEMVKSQDVIAEGESATFHLVARPVSEDEPWDDSYKVRINLTVDGGPGKLDKLSCTIGETVKVTATRGLFGLLSSVGNRISITARENNKGKGVIILPITGQFTVGRKSELSLLVSPKDLEMNDDDNIACKNVTAAALLSDTEGNPIPDQTIHFELNGVRVGSATTGSNGTCEMTIGICPSDLSGGERAKSLTIRAVYNGQSHADSLHSGASATFTVNVSSLIKAPFSGRVRNARNNDAISGVNITIKGPYGTVKGTTDAQGSYTFKIKVPKEELERMNTPLIITASKKGYEPVTINTTAFEYGYDFEMTPQEIVLTGTVYDEETKIPISGGFGEISQPFAKSFGTGADGGFMIEGLYVGDRVTITAWAINHRAYTKSGVITSTAPHLSFYLPVGEGKVKSGLDEEDRGDDGEDTEGPPISYSLTIWASPADPGPGQGVTVTALIHPIQAGITVRLAIFGTDGYANSIITTTDATGRAYLYIPGGNSGVVDRVTVTLLDQALSRRLNYTF